MSAAIPVVRLLSLPVLLVLLAFLVWTIGWLLALPLMAVVTLMVFRVFDAALGEER